MAKLLPLRDHHIVGIRERWYSESHPEVNKQEFLPLAREWFLSTKINQLDGVDQFPFQDVIHGCTHYIENLVLKHGWSGIQVLNYEYAYYGLMGKHGVTPDQLQAEMPLIVSLPNWRWLDLRADWPEILKICEQRRIPIHIDMAWITAAQGIELDLAHPAIESFAMSLSKYAMEWNRVGIRWCRQRTMDSITIFNHFERSANTGLTSAGAWIIDQLPRDYGWINYGQRHQEISQRLAAQPSNIIHAVLKDSEPYGIADLLVSDTAFAAQGPESPPQHRQ